MLFLFFFFSSRRRHTRCSRDWSSDVCSSDLFTGFESPRPGVVVEYTERGGRAGEARLDIPKVAVERPSALAALVRDGRDGLEQLEVRVKVDTEKDERAELVKRAAEERGDRQILS